MNIKEKIKAVMKEKGVNQDVIAHELGIAQSNFSEKLNKSKDIKIGFIYDIADKLGMDIVDIITYPDKWAIVTEDCQKCKSKDEIINNLNEYINVIKSNRRSK